jgi:hypothetical protein
MASTLGGDDPLHDLDDSQKQKEEKALRQKARTKGVKPKDRKPVDQQGE